MLQLEGLIERLDEGRFINARDYLENGGTLLGLLAELDEDSPVRRLIEAWMENRRGRERRKRQRKKYQAQIGRLTGERDRARRDRDTFAKYILEHVDDTAITGKSGQREVLTGVDGSQL